MVLVATPAELPVNETVEAVNHLEGEGRVPSPIVVMNRVLPLSGLTSRDINAHAPGPWRDAAGHQIALEDEQSGWLNALDADASLPYLRGVFTPEEVALQLADELGDS